MSAQSAKNIKNRIKSIKNTARITNAMKLVASSKSKRAIVEMENPREYYNEILKIISQAAAENEAGELPYFRKSNTGGKSCAIVISGDRGLAGGYNINIFKEAIKLKEADIIPIGRKGCEKFLESKMRIVLVETVTWKNIEDISKMILKKFSDGEYNDVYIIHTEFITALSQIPKTTKILPIASAEKEDNKVIKKLSAAVYEPSAYEVLRKLVFQYMCSAVYSMAKESFACETAARRAAMESASKSADEMLDRLYMDYNRARQSAVTQELNEIVSGAGIV